ncbi:MAG: Hpt domain-containing protein [Desulfovibrionaceae bacterium]|nr:Hpt domain-containing protein [Desulfovibrionaceae bacterium]
MNENEALVEEFMAELNDKYYPQVARGLELVEAGEIGPGMDMLARPLHTIKGVTGFMSGFEPASRFTHKVENLLKRIRSAQARPERSDLDLFSRSVNAIFSLIENIKDQGRADLEQLDELTALLEAAAGQKIAAAPSQDPGLARLENGPNGAIIGFRPGRVHLEPERRALAEALKSLPPDAGLTIDLTGVASFGSAAWEVLADSTRDRSVSVTGMAPACREVFYAYGYDRDIRVLADEDGRDRGA